MSNGDGNLSSSGTDTRDAGGAIRGGNGLPLPEVVHRLLKETNVIRWDGTQR